MVNRVLAVLALVVGAAIAAGACWSVAAGERSAWTLLLVPPWVLAWWWLSVGFRRRA